MKTKISVIITLAIFLSACSATSSTAKKEKAAADYEHIAALIESGNYQFSINSASPSGGRRIQITSPYIMTVKEGKFDADLPYFGRVYTGAGAYGEAGVKFKGEPEKLTITRKDNKNKISLEFFITTDTDNYNVNLDVGASGYGNMLVSNPNKQSISYTGLISELKN